MFKFCYECTENGKFNYCNMLNYLICWLKIFKMKEAKFCNMELGNHTIWRREIPQIEGKILPNGGGILNNGGGIQQNRRRILQNRIGEY